MNARIATRFLDPSPAIAAFIAHMPTGLAQRFSSQVPSNRTRQEEIVRPRHDFGASGKPLRLLLAVAALGAACTALPFPQGNAPAQLPNGPAKPGFDIRRFSLTGGAFKTFDVDQTDPLQKELKHGRALADTP